MRRGISCIWIAFVLVATSVPSKGQATNTFPSTGSVGIGTTSPNFPLTVRQSYQAAGYFGVVAASTNVTSNVGSPLVIQNTSATPGDYSAFLFYDANSNMQGSLGMMYGNHTGMGQGTFYIEPRIVGTPSSFVVAPNGNVGVGTTSPGAKLEVNGNLRFSGDAAGVYQTTAWTGVLCGGDYAEAVETTEIKERYEPGDVLVISAEAAGKVKKSSEPYATNVSGIYATKPGVVGKRESLAKATDDIPMAMVGIVPTKVSAENGAIHPGDLLVTSSREGYAMKGTDRGMMLGAVIGKAMGTLEVGTGTVEVLVTLQ